MKTVPSKTKTTDFLPQITPDRTQERPLFAEADEITSSRSGGRGAVRRRYRRKEA